MLVLGSRAASCGSHNGDRIGRKRRKHRLGIIGSRIRPVDGSYRRIVTHARVKPQRGITKQYTSTKIPCPCQPSLLSYTYILTALPTQSCVRETCVRRLHASWGVTICRCILPFARGCRVWVWYGFVGAALLPAVGTCVVLAFGAVPGRCCFLRVTQTPCNQPAIAHGFNRTYALVHCEQLQARTSVTVCYMATQHRLPLAQVKLQVSRNNAVDVAA